MFAQSYNACLSTAGCTNSRLAVGESVRRRNSTQLNTRAHSGNVLIFGSASNHLAANHPARVDAYSVLFALALRGDVLINLNCLEEGCDECRGALTSLTLPDLAVAPTFRISQALLRPTELHFKPVLASYSIEVL